MSTHHKEVEFPKWTYSLWVLIICLCVLFLLTVSRVGTTTLWGDEAFRAQIAKGVLKTGLPSHWDGTRYTVGVNELALSKLFPEKYVEVSSWFQYYIIAVFYGLFGANTFTTRLPFWLAAFGIFYILYRYRYLFSKPDKTFTYAAIIMLFNVTFLIYTLQANYYIYSLLFTVWSSFIFFDILRHKKLPVLNLVFLFIVNQLLAHNHIPTAVTLFIIQSAFLGWHVLKKSWHEKIKLGLYLVLSAVLLYFDYKLYSSSEGLSEAGKYFMTSMVVFINAINFYIFPMIGFLLLLFVLWKYKKNVHDKRWLLYIFLVTVLHLLLMSYFTFGQAMPFRYISAYMVLWFIALAIVISSVPKSWAITIFAFAIIPNFFTGISKLYTSVLLPKSVLEMVKRDVPLIPKITDNPIRCYFCEFMGEMFDPKPHPLENIVKALNVYGVENKKIIVGPCEGNTIMFGTGGIVIDQMPPKLYEKTYRKPYEMSDAEVIVNNAFCSWQLNHEDVLKLGYKFEVIQLSPEAFIHDGELNVRNKFAFPFQPLAIIYYR